LRSNDSLEIAGLPDREDIGREPILAIQAACRLNASDWVGH
jgi:hypothetical protein